MKKKTLIILGVILIVLIGVGFYFFSNQSTYKVIINNKTNKEISGLQISYSNNSKNISVPSIKSRWFRGSKGKSRGKWFFSYVLYRYFRRFS